MAYRMGTCSGPGRVEGAVMVQEEFAFSPQV
jgi:hypothetical protein